MPTSKPSSSSSFAANRLLWSSSYPYGDPRGFSARFTPSTAPSFAHKYPQHSLGASSRACATSSSQCAREILTRRRLVCGAMAPYLTRREAFGGAAAAVVLASCGGGDPPPSGGPRPGSGAALLGSLLALEHAVIAAYGACGEVLSGRAAQQARAIRAQERGHASGLTRLIDELGGDP